MRARKHLPHSVRISVLKGFLQISTSGCLGVQHRKRKTYWYRDGNGDGACPNQEAYMWLTNAVLNPGQAFNTGKELLAVSESTWMLNSPLCYWKQRLQPMHVIFACGILHISWSWRVGFFPWHFAAHSLHFTQQRIQFLLLMGLCVSATPEMGSAGALLHLCAGCYKERWKFVTSKELTHCSQDKQWEALWFLGLSCLWVAFSEGTVSFSSSDHSHSEVKAGKS